RAPCVARGSVHGADARRGRVQGVRGLSSVAARAVPPLAFKGKVTQARVVVSEWTKLHSLRSTRWSLGVAVLLTIGLPLLFAAVPSSHWWRMSAYEHADWYKIVSTLAG